MIVGQVCVKIVFDDSGKENIASALHTLKEIDDAFESVGAFTGFEQDTLTRAIALLADILAKKSF